MNIYFECMVNHPNELLTLHVYDPMSDGSRSFKLNTVVLCVK